ncbi:hypothetical protein [Chitinophaga vietnamensis]|uniref:hypothetical protein n=1 Tax=Chitinophaga vietnamensis TaxID=2593957 RepID=UPI0011788E83|nr:hypothetical protein [Chitinophaga vietnamensis]
MVIFYQVVVKPLTSKVLADEPCPVCGKKGGVQVTLYSRYISALLPVFGLGTRTGVHCGLCSHEIKNPQASVFAKQQYSPAIAAAITDIRRTYKRSLWQLLYPWTLCWCFLLLIAVAWFAGAGRRHRDANNRALLANPQPGDIYKARWDDAAGADHGMLVKLNRIEGDTMYVALGAHSIPVSFNADDWAKLSSQSETFGPQELKVSYSRFKASSDFYEYLPPAPPVSDEQFTVNRNSDRVPLTYKGQVAAKGSVNFDVVERKQ